MRKIAILIVKLYQKYISPIKPSCCRFYPTCSSYAIEALQKHGFCKGGLLSIYRIIRCNPFNKGGVDLVPPIRDKRVKSKD